MFKFLSIILVSITLSFIACKQKGGKEKSDGRDVFSFATGSSIQELPNDSMVRIVIPKSINHEQSVKVSNLIKNLSYIKLETTDDCLIGEITDVKFFNGRIYIMDNRISKKVFCFDISGKFISLIGKKGDGPGEMDDPLSFSITKGGIDILDRQNRIFSYNEQGEYQKMFRLPMMASAIQSLDESKLLIYSNDINVEKKLQYHLVCWDKKSNTITSKINYMDCGYTVGDEPFGLYQNHNTILYHRIFSDTVFHLIEGKTLKPSFLIDFDGQGIPKSFLNNPSKLTATFSDDKFNMLFSPFIETDSFFIFSTGKKYRNSHFYSKKEKKQACFNTISDDLFYGGFRPLSPITTLNDKMVFIVNLPYLMQKYSKIISSKDTKLINQFLIERSLFMKIGSLSKEDDNPILLLANINSAIFN